MKTILYMTLTVNGYLKQVDKNHPIFEERLKDFTQHMIKHGNVINGRGTYNLLKDSIDQGQYSNFELVVVSNELSSQTHGVHVVASPQKALNFLEEKGFKQALVAGGAELNGAFLSQGLVGEIYLNVAPNVLGNGFPIPMNKHYETDLTLVNVIKLSERMVQLHYRVLK